MSIEQHIKEPNIAGFLGENRDLADVLLPPNVSPDALNNDSVDRTLRKRKGFIRMDDRPFFNGGLRVVNTSATSYGATLEDVPITSLTGSFAIGFWVAFASVGANLNIVSRLASLSDKGVAVKFIDGSDEIQFYIGTGAASSSTLTHTADVTDNSRRHYILCVYEDLGANHDLHIAIDGVLESKGSTSGNFDPDATDNLLIAQLVGVALNTSDFNIDDIRVWDLSAEADIDAWIAEHKTLDYGERVLLDGETEDGLIAYFPFDRPSTMNDRVSDYAVTFTNPASTDTINGCVIDRGIICGPYIEPRVRAFTRLGEQPDELSHDMFALTDTAAYKITASSLDMETFWTKSRKRSRRFMGPSPEPTTPEEPWSLAPFRKHVICAKKGANALFRFDGTSMYYLTPPAPDVSGVTQSVLADGPSGLTNGVYRYVMFYYNSTHDIVGAMSDIITVDNSSGPTAALCEFAVLPTLVSAQLLADYGVDKLRIFRTPVNGDEYRFLIELDVSASETGEHVDDAFDSELGDPISIDGYDAAGECPASAFTFIHDNRVFAGNQSGTESQVRYTEGFTLERFDTDNFIDFRKDDGNELTGGISARGGAVVTKRDSIWSIGTGGTANYTPRMLYDGEGCVAHNTLAASNMAVYGLGPYGVMAIPLPVGAGTPVNITDDSHRSLFETMLQEKWKTACGAFYPRTKQYWISFDTTSGRVTMVFNERTKSWQKYDLPVEAFHVLNSKAGSVMLLGSVRGYLVRLDYGHNDGADVVDNLTLGLSGLVTSSTDNTFTVTGAGWPTETYSGDAATSLFSRPLAGVRVFVKSQTTGLIQDRVVYFNTDDTVYVDEAWDINPVAGDTYYFGPIEWYWESPLIALDNDRTSKKIVNRFYTLFRNPTGGNVQAELTFDDKDAIIKQLDSSNRFVEVQPRSRGRELKIRVENVVPDQPIEIEAFGWLFSQDEPRTANG